MSENEEVWVLGAGAAQPYGFPCGKGLSKDLLKNEFIDSLITQYNLPRQQVMGFRDGFAQFLTGDPEGTIDSYLQGLPRDDRRFDVGRRAIAAQLILNEDDAILATAASPRGWYGRFFDHFIKPMRTSRSVSFEAPVVVTFNYDRSLEKFVEMRLGERCWSPKEVVEALERFVVLHVYGGLGELPSMGISSEVFVREYSPKVDAQTIADAAHSIHIMAQGERVSGVASVARTRIARARRVRIIGFGFDKLNCELLRLDEAGSELQGPIEVDATAFDLRSTRARCIRDYLEGSGRCDRSLRVGGCQEDALDFLNRLIARGAGRTA